MRRHSKLRWLTAELEISPEASARVSATIMESEPDRVPVKSPPQATPQPKIPQREKSGFLLGDPERGYASCPTNRVHPAAGVESGRETYCSVTGSVGPGPPSCW